MKSEELAVEVRSFAEFCASRITGTGAEQYEKDGVQRFESMSPEDILVFIDEELADIVNYAVMTRLRLRKIVLGATVAIMHGSQGGWR